MSEKQEPLDLSVFCYEAVENDTGAGKDQVTPRYGIET